MRTRIVFVLAMTAASVCLPAAAEEWISLSKTTDGHPTEIFLDLSSITVTDNIRTARTKAVLLSPRGHDEKRIEFAIQPMSFDCNASRVQAGSVEIHYTDIQELGFIDTRRSWEPIDDPLTKKMLDLVCDWEPTRRS